MKHIRPIDWDSGTDAGIPGYRGQILYAGESCYVIATKVPPGVEGPARHTHASDQIYVVLEGTTTIELGAEERQVSRYGSVFIPAGVPHHNRNDGGEVEVHIEVIAPGGFLQPIASPTDSTDAKPGKAKGLTRTFSSVNGVAAQLTGAQIVELAG